MIVDGAEGWYISAESCVRATVDNVENNIAKSNQRLHIHCKTLIMYGYWPETSTSLEIKYEGVTHYQERVGLLRWSVELGQVYILLETELMSIYLALPCGGILNSYSTCLGTSRRTQREIFALILSIQQPISNHLLCTVGMASTGMSRRTYWKTLQLQGEI